MFDLFLGMGRANKKDKDKDREKSNAYSIEGAKEDPDDEQSKAVAVPQTEGRLVESKKVKEVQVDGATTKGQRVPPSKTACAAAALSPAAGAAGGMGAANGPVVADPSGCDCCGRSHAVEGGKAGSGALSGGVGTGVVAGAGGGADSTWGQGTTRSMMPAPPAGPAGSLPSAASSVAPQPLGPKAFAVEVAAVERGLHIQLGESGVKTEAQLGDEQLEAAKRLRHLLSSNKERMIQELLQRGWVPLLLRWLGLVHRPSLQVEALWALTNIAQSTTEHTPLLLKHGAVGMLVGLLKSPSLEVAEQAMWVLGNMAQEGQDGTAARDAVLQAGALGPLVRCMEQHPSLLSLQRIGAWSLCNLFDGQPRPTVDVPTVMPAINRLLRSGDSEVLSHACSALSHLCDGSAAHIKVVVESGVCKRLVELLDHPSWRVVKPALRTIGNVVCAEDDADYTEAILEAGSVACLKKLIAHPNREIQKEACWTLSNIAAGSVSQIQSVLDSGAMPQLIKLATSADTESEVRSEAFWVVLNAASCGSDAQIEYLVSQGCVQILSDLLGENSMVMMALEGIERVLSVGDLRVVRNAIASHIHTDQQGSGNAAGDDAHCVECASVAAVGAAAAAAATAPGDNTSGAIAPDSGTYTNPYACMLTPEKIQALEAHKDTAIAKRANRVWARYFVTCAICRRSFSRHGSSATFCTECKCHVCGSCDCTVFHLAYQDKLWQEMEGKERKGKQAQQAAKKNKKAKKREKKKMAARDVGTEASKGGKADAGRVNETANGDGGRSQVAKGPVRGAGVATASPPAPQGEKTRASASADKESHCSASSESNSEDECHAPTSPRSRAPASSSTSAAAAIINATAAVVTAAVKAATPGSVVSRPVEGGAAAGAKTDGKKTKAPSGVVRSGSSTSPATLVADPAANGSSKVEVSQRRAGDKRGKREDRAAVLPTISESSQGGLRTGAPVDLVAFVSPQLGRGVNVGKSSRVTAGRSTDDDNEEPWVVVGSKGAPPSAGSAGGRLAGGAGVSGAKLTKRKKGQRDASSGATSSTAVAGPPGTGGGSVVEWASESGPAALKVTAKSKVTTSTPVAKPAVSNFAGAPAASTTVGGTTRVFVSSSLSGVGPPGSARIGNPWGVTPKMPTAQGTAVGGTPPLPVNGFQSVNGTKSSQPSTRRPGPGPGSVWGATPPVVISKKAGSSAAAAVPAGLGKSTLPRAPAASPRAGIIGPPQVMAGKQASRPGAVTTFKPLGSSALLPAAEALAQRPLAASINRMSSPVGGGNPGGGRAGGVGDGARNGVILSGGSSVSVGGGKPSAPSVAPSANPSKQRAVMTNGPSRNGGSNGGDGEALVENEKLVSFLIETGSILALAQRLEEEEECRLAAPSPTSSGPR